MIDKSEERKISLKKSAKLIYSISTITLLILCLLSIAVSAAATDTAAPPSNTGYGLYITCYYSGADEDNTPDLADTQENVFLLTSKTSGQYVVAEYQEQTNTYQVTDYTTSSDKATQFRCGSDPDFPQDLRIHGLTQDTYLLCHTQTQSGYLTLDDIEISLSPDGAIVNGNTTDSYADPVTGQVTIPLQLTICYDFELPLSECGLICWSYSKFGFDIFSTLGCILIVGCSIALFLVIRFSRNDQPSEQT